MQEGFHLVNDVVFHVKCGTRAIQKPLLTTIEWVCEYCENRNFGYRARMLSGEYKDWELDVTTQTFTTIVDET